MKSNKNLYLCLAVMLYLINIVFPGPLLPRAYPTSIQFSEQLLKNSGSKLLALNLSHSLDASGVASAGRSGSFYVCISL